METASRRIQELRVLIGGLEGPPSREFQPAPELEIGIPRGVLVELVGSAKTEFLLEFLRLNAEHQIFWIEDKQTLLPPAVQQRGVDLSRIRFATISTDVYQGIRQILQSQLFQVAVAPSIFDEDRMLKGLQLLAERANANIFLLGKKPRVAWPIKVQLEISRKRGGGFSVAVLKHKYAGG